MFFCLKWHIVVRFVFVFHTYRAVLILYCLILWSLWLQALQVSGKMIGMGRKV